jgi:hypothetical protein
MIQKSMFAIYLYEDEAGQVYVRADSYGNGEKALSMGFQILEHIIRSGDPSGGDMLVMLPVDRCPLVQ